MQALLAKIISGKHKNWGLIYTIISMNELSELNPMGEDLYWLHLIIHEAIECGDAARLRGRVKHYREAAQARLTSESTRTTT